MKRRWLASWWLVALVAPAVPAQDVTLVERVREALGRAEVGLEFRAASGARHAFAAALTRGLETCDGIDLEVRIREDGTVLVRAYPRIRGERPDPRRSADRPALLARLDAARERLAPLAWATDGDPALHARCSIRGDDAALPDALARALRAASAVDREVADLEPALRPALSDEEIAARLREAATADEAGRARVLASLVAYLPEVAPSEVPGQSAFGKIVLNSRGAAFDAFRFRVPEDGGDRRLVWAFAYPPGTAKGWYIAPVEGDAPRFVKFHRGRRYEGSGVPAEHATLLQRSETPLRPGAEYVLWFQFKVETPVDLYVALGCYPFASADRDAPDALEAALGLVPAR